jgi:hypothetical protein
MTTRITANQREILSVADSISGTPFYLRGNSSDGSLNVNITSGVITSITGTVTVQDASAENSLTSINSVLTSGTVKVSGTEINGDNIATTAPGVPLTSLAGPTGDPIDTYKNSLKTYSQIADDLGNTPRVITTNAPGNNSLMVSPARSSLIPWSIASVTTTPGYYVGNYMWVSVQILTLYVGATPTITFQGSNDNINWVSVDLASTVASSIPAISATAAGIFHGPLNFPYFRLSFSGTYTSGRSTGTIVFSTLSGALTTISANPTTGLPVAGVKTNNAAAPAATNLGVLPALANANNPLYTETFQVLPSVDLMGQTRIVSRLPLSVNNQQIDGDNVETSRAGVQFISLAGPTGDPINTVGNDLAVAVSGTVIAQSPLVNAPLVGQAKIAVTGTAVQLNAGTTQALTNGLIISAPAGNVAPIAVGGSNVTNTANGSGNGYLIAPGASVSFAMANTNQIWINGTSGDYVSWAGS